MTYRFEVLGGWATFTTNTIIYVRETKFNIREKLYKCWKVFKMRGLLKVKFSREFDEQMTELISSNQVRAKQSKIQLKTHFSHQKSVMIWFTGVSATISVKIITKLGVHVFCATYTELTLASFRHLEL